MMPDIDGKAIVTVQEAAISYVMPLGKGAAIPGEASLAYGACFCCGLLKSSTYMKQYTRFLT